MTWATVHDGADGPLLPGQVRGAQVADRYLVVWRSTGGQVRVMDARCPHQWSPLDQEGYVDGDDLVCAAHDWRFDGEGRGWKCSASGRRDRKGDVATYAVRVTGARVEADVPEAG